MTWSAWHAGAFACAAGVQEASEPAFFVRPSPPSGASSTAQPIHMADEDEGDILRIMIASDNHLGYMVMRARAPRQF